MCYGIYLTCRKIWQKKETECRLFKPKIPTGYKEIPGWQAAESVAAGPRSYWNIYDNISVCFCLE